MVGCVDDPWTREPTQSAASGLPVQMFSVRTEMSASSPACLSRVVKPFGGADSCSVGWSSSAAMRLSDTVLYSNTLMYLISERNAHGALRAVGGAARTGAVMTAGAARAGLVLTAAVALGIGVPALWLKLGAAVLGVWERGPMAAATVVFVLAGIAASYLAIIAAARRLAAWLSPPAP